MPCKSKMTMSKISELSSHTYMYVFNHMDTKYVDWNIWMTFVSLVMRSTGYVSRKGS